MTDVCSYQNMVWFRLFTCEESAELGLPEKWAEQFRWIDITQSSPHPIVLCWNMHGWCIRSRSCGADSSEHARKKYQEGKNKEGGKYRTGDISFFLLFTVPQFLPLQFFFLILPVLHFHYISWSAFSYPAFPLRDWQGGGFKWQSSINRHLVYFHINSSYYTKLGMETAFKFRGFNAKKK